MEKTVNAEWMRGFQRNLAFICKLEEALPPESFKQVCGFVNEYRKKKCQYGYRLRDREEIEKQVTPLLVAHDQDLLCKFLEILASDDVAKKSSMPSGSNNKFNAMHDPIVEINPEKSGHLSTNPKTSDRIQLKSAGEDVHHYHTRRHNGSITSGKYVGLEDVQVLNPDDPSQLKRRRIQRPTVEPIISSDLRRHDVVGDISLESKKWKDCDKHMQRVRQDEHIVHGEQNEYHHRLHEHHDDKRMCVRPQIMKPSCEEIHGAQAASFIANLSKLGDRTLLESIENVLRLFRDKKLPSYYANKCVCMLLEAHKKLLNEFCELIGFKWLPEVNIRCYNGGRVGLRDRAFKQYTYIEEAAKNDKLCSLKKDVPLFEVDNVGKKICKGIISLDTQLHKDMLEEKQFSNNIKEKLKANQNHRWWPGCTLKDVTPNVGSEFQATRLDFLVHPHNSNDHAVTPNVSFEFQASAVIFLAHPHNSNDHVVTPTEGSKFQASAVDFLAHPRVSNDQTTTIKSHKNDLISEGTSSMGKLESDLSRFLLETIVKLDNALSNVKRMLFEVQEHPPNRSCNS